MQTPTSHVTLSGARVEESVRSSDDSSSDDNAQCLLTNGERTSALVKHHQHEYTLSVQAAKEEPVYLVFHSREEKVTQSSAINFDETSLNVTTCRIAGYTTCAR